MPPPKKKGPTGTCQITLTGRSLEVLQAICEIEDFSLQDGIRSVIRRWIASSEGRQTLKDSYGIEIANTRKVVNLGERRR